jgi:predicted MFS family arabinose efflux permease
MAAALMAVSMIIVPLLMRDDSPTQRERSSRAYAALLASLPGLARAYPHVLISGVIQGMSFAIFLATWLGIGLYLTGPELGLGTDIVGYLAACSAVGLLTTPRLGKLADRLGAERARMIMAGLQLLSVATLPLARYEWMLLLIPILITSIAGPLIDITGRMTSLSQPPDIRTRLMSLYITLMFIGGGIGSWAGTLAYDARGWSGTVALTLALSACVCALSWREHRCAQRPPPTA